MKIVKTTLLIGFLVGIVFIIIKMVGGGGIDELEDSVIVEKNQFIIEIDTKIDSLANQPEISFSQPLYKDVLYRINDYGSQQHFGDTEQKNNQVREALLKNLYSTYAPKYVEQAMYVFGRSEWKLSDMNLIRSELTALAKSPYLESQSEVANSFTKIRSILTKYDEIIAFVNSCKSLTVPVDQMDHKFPDVADKVQRSGQYLSANLENAFVNNCSRLKDELRNLPKYLGDINYAYLLKKIDFHGSRYTEFNLFNDYRTAITKKLRPEVITFRERFPQGNHQYLLSLIKEYEVKADDFINK